MFDFLSYGADKLQAFMLVNFRLGGLMLAAPVLGSHAIPHLVKLGLTVTLAILLMPLILGAELPAVGSLADVTALGVKEFMVGVIIGLTFKMLIYSLQTAGSLVGFQSGLSIANVIDPSNQSQVNIIGEFWTLVGTLIFITINGHHLAIAGLADSYRFIPIGGALFGSDAGELLIRLTGAVMTMAIKFAGPIILTIFLVDVALGVLARTIPQMNIFVIGMPVKIAAAMLMLGVTLPVFAWALERMTGYLDSQMNVMMGALAGG